MDNADPSDPRVTSGLRISQAFLERIGTAPMRARAGSDTDVMEPGPVPAPAPAAERSSAPAPEPGAATEAPSNRSPSSRPNPWARQALEMGESLIDRRQQSYRVVRFIGRGGMGEVYEVEQEGNGQRFAVKCMRLANLGNPFLLERAASEATVLERLRHPNVVPVYSMGVREDGLIWMVMRLLSGRTLGQILKAVGKLPMPWALSILSDVCAGLRAIHVWAIHRDIKPDNILVDPDGHVWVLDLGAGKFFFHGLATTGGFSIGTLAYMSPEQLLEPRSIDHRSDQFSIGICLYEALSGRNPFVEEDAPQETLAVGTAILHREPAPLREIAPLVPPYVAEIVHRLLSKERKERFDHIEQVERVLRAALDRMAEELGPSAPLRALCEELDRRELAELTAGAASRDMPRAGVAGDEGPFGTRRIAFSGGGTEIIPSRRPAPKERAAAAETERISVPETRPEHEAEGREAPADGAEASAPDGASRDAEPRVIVQVAPKRGAAAWQQRLRRSAAAQRVYLAWPGLWVAIGLAVGAGVIAGRWMGATALSAGGASSAPPGPPPSMPVGSEPPARIMSAPPGPDVRFEAPQSAPIIAVSSAAVTPVASAASSAPVLAPVPAVLPSASTTTAVAADKRPPRRPREPAVPQPTGAAPAAAEKAPAAPQIFDRPLNLD